MTKLDDLRITILVDNVATHAEFRAEHGFSCLIEANGARVLFDTGARDALLHNARRLGVKLLGLDALVFSHGHYDHTGGLEAVIQQLGRIRFVAHPNLLGAHRSQRTGRDRDIGIPDASREAMRHLHAEFSADPVEVVPGIWTTGEIPRVSTNLDEGELFLDAEGTRQDQVLDDMALVLRHRAGLVVLLGCAHAGVVDTVARVEQLFPGETLLGLLGGMHLERAAPQRIRHVVERLRTRQLKLVSPGHCSGERAKRALLEAYGSSYLSMQVGLEVRFDPAGQVSHVQLPLA